MSSTFEGDLPAKESPMEEHASTLQRLRRYVNRGGPAQRRLELGLAVFVSSIVLVIASGLCPPKPRAATMADPIASAPKPPPSCDDPAAMERFQRWLDTYEERAAGRQGRRDEDLEVHAACARKDAEQGTASLDGAAMVGNLRTVQWLLAVAPVQRRDLARAALEADAHPEVVAMLRSKGAPPPTLLEAAQANAPNAARAALERQNHEPRELLVALTRLLQRTPHCNGCDPRAYARDQVRTVGTFFAKGAQVDGEALAALCERGREMTEAHLATALANRHPGAIEHALGRMSHVVPESVVRRVAAQGIDWGWRDGEDDAPMPLVRAIESRNEALVRVLVELGAPVDRVYKDGSSALQAAVTCAEEETACGRITEFLLAHGADANRRFPDGTTPLFAAAEAGNGRVVRALIDEGARLETRVVRETALNAAERSGHALAARILAARGARVPGHD